MNHPDCPKEVYEAILAGLGTIEYKEYGNRNNFIAECLSSMHAVDHYTNSDISGSGILKFLPSSIFLQKNKTKNY